MNQDRQIALERGVNFRDLGGYQTADGRTVKWRRVFRSAKLSELTANDQHVVRGLALQSVIDFRRRMERSDEPSLWHEDHTPNVITKPHPLDDRVSSNRVMGQFVESMRAPREMMKDVYWDMPESQAAHYREMFVCLYTEEHLPLLIHCTAGKDRTGLGAALILHALGVDRDTIFEDYLLTNQMYPVDERAQQTAKNMIEKYNLEGIEPEQMRDLFMVHEEYLDHALKRIIEDFGGIDTYIETELGVSPDKLEALRSHLLE